MYRARQAEAATARTIGGDHHLASQLAAAMSLFTDAEQAARWAGLPLEGDDLVRIEGLARQHHQGVIDSDVVDFGKRVLACCQLVTQSLVQNRASISPRDLPHVLRALAQARDLVAGKTPSAQFAEINLSVIGADGKALEVTK